MQQQLERFFSNAPLAHISMDIVGPLARPEEGNQFAAIIMEPYTKLTKSKLTPKKRAKTVSRVLSEH